MIYNRIPIAFNGLNKVTGPTISYQYDVRTVLVFEDLDLPQYYEADICNEGDTTTVTMVGTADGVLIPNAFLRNGRRVKVYIVVQGTDPGAIETRKELTLPVQTRPAREDIDPTEPEQQQIDELVAALNEATEAAAAVAEAIPPAGYQGQILAKRSDDDYDTEWIDSGGGGGGTSNYNELTNKPSINSVELRGNKSLSDIGAYEKPSGGIPGTDLSSDVQTSLGKADTALQSAPVESVAGKTGTVTLDGGDVGYSDQTTYSSGTVGAEVSALKTEISSKPDIDLGITGASVGKFAKVAAVDANGKPTSWAFGSGGGGSGDADGLRLILLEQLIPILQAGVYTSDQSDEIMALMSALQEGGITPSFSNNTLTLSGFEASPSWTIS